jgi:hypothetical protein
MNEILENKLKIKYPFYKDIYSECGNGWYELIDKLFSYIAISIKNYQIRNFSIAQIKEKFGGLRVYPNLYFDIKIASTINGLINNAEKESLFICELCGKEGKLINKNGWLMVRCEECKK